MAALLIILIGTVLIQGSATAGGPRPAKRARGVTADELRAAAFTLLTITVSAAMGFAVTHYVLAPLKLDYMRTPVLLCGAALIFVAARRLFERIPGAIRWPDLLAHLTTQVALFAMALFTAVYSESMLGALGDGLGAAAALALLNSAFTALVGRLDEADVPFVFRGIPVALITAGFMALALMGFAGMISG